MRASYKKLEKLDDRLRRAKGQRDAAAAAAVAAAAAEDGDDSDGEPAVPPPRVTRGQLEEAAKVSESTQGYCDFERVCSQRCPF